MDRSFEGAVISCPQRVSVRAATMRSFAQSDWRPAPVVLVSRGTHPLAIERIRNAWQRALTYAANSCSEVVLLTEDDIVVGRSILHNVRSWRPIHEMRDGWFFGSLYNPGVPRVRDEGGKGYFVVRPEHAWGAQAILVSPRTARLVLGQWPYVRGHPDEIMPRLASTRSPVFYHAPSLVDHRDVPSTWGGLSHRARDFDCDWRSHGEEFQRHKAT